MQPTNCRLRASVGLRRRRCSSLSLALHDLAFSQYTYIRYSPMLMPGGAPQRSCTHMPPVWQAAGVPCAFCAGPGAIFLHFHRPLLMLCAPPRPASCRRRTTRLAYHRGPPPFHSGVIRCQRITYAPGIPAYDVSAAHAGGFLGCIGILAGHARPPGMPAAAQAQASCADIDRLFIWTRCRPQLAAQ